MNLSAEQYLNLVDQMSKLKIQNKKYQEDNSKLTNELQKQKGKCQQPQQHSLVPANNYISRFDDKSRAIKTANDYVEDFKNSMSVMQKNICECITKNADEQITYLKEEIKVIRHEIKTIAQSNLQNKQNLSPGVKKSSYQNNFHVTAHKEEPEEEYNPIQAAKKARSSKSQERNILTTVENKIASSTRKSARKQSKAKLKEQTDRNDVEKYIQHYKEENYNKVEADNDFKSTKSFVEEPADVSRDMSVLPPKIVEEKKKKSESIKNKNGESKLKKVTKLQKDLMTRSGQLKVVNEEKLIKPKSESKQKIKLSSKNIISPPKQAHEKQDSLKGKNIPSSKQKINQEAKPKNTKISASKQKIEEGKSPGSKKIGKGQGSKKSIAQSKTMNKSKQMSGSKIKIQRNTQGKQLQKTKKQGSKRKIEESKESKGQNKSKLKYKGDETTQQKKIKREGSKVNIEAEKQQRRSSKLKKGESSNKPQKNEAPKIKKSESSTNLNQNKAERAHKRQSKDFRNNLPDPNTSKPKGDKSSKPELGKNGSSRNLKGKEKLS